MKILVLSVYPITDPRHGGQIRLRNIVDQYRSDGHEVQVVGILSSAHYSKEPGFVAFPGYERLENLLPNPSLMEDLLVGWLVSQDAKHFNQLKSLIHIQADVWHIEQPWLVGFYERFFEDQSSKPTLIYGSQNIEHEIKKKILASSFGPALLEQRSELIREEEVRAIKKADAVICVSAQDKEWIANYTTQPILVAANGVRVFSETVEGMSELGDFVRDSKYALFCASMYPPNVTGFFKVFSGGFGSLNPDQFLAIAGSVGYALLKDVRMTTSAKLTDRTRILGEVSFAALDTLLSRSHCIVLPIDEGGGTNLKTAEALISGKYVVCTKVALRGFESFEQAPGVFVANDAADFKRKLRHVMSLEPLSLSAEHQSKRKTLLWSECLRKMTSFVRSVADSRMVR